MHPYISGRLAPQRSSSTRDLPGTLSRRTVIEGRSFLRMLLMGFAVIRLMYGWIGDGKHVMLNNNEFIFLVLEIAVALLSHIYTQGAYE